MPPVQVQLAVGNLRLVQRLLGCCGLGWVSVLDKGAGRRLTPLVPQADQARDACSVTVLLEVCQQSLLCDSGGDHSLQDVLHRPDGHSEGCCGS